VISVDGQRVHVVNLHLTAPSLRWATHPELPLPLVTGEVTQGRDNEVHDLIPLLRPLIDGAEPLVAAGDLNMTDQTPEFRRLRSLGLLDAHREAGWGFGNTFPAVQSIRIVGRSIAVPMPLLRIDHVLVSDEFVVRGVQTGPAGGGSDHLPVTADLVRR
jgi:endonuclease/exonuclease/phosphatase family metal-dependent hydrolase